MSDASSMPVCLTQKTFCLLRMKALPLPSANPQSLQRQPSTVSTQIPATSAIPARLEDGTVFDVDGGTTSRTFAAGIASGTHRSDAGGWGGSGSGGMV